MGENGFLGIHADQDTGSHSDFLCLCLGQLTACYRFLELFGSQLDGLRFFCSRSGRKSERSHGGVDIGIGS